jgi:hypothetical protein
MTSRPASTTFITFHSRQNVGPRRLIRRFVQVEGGQSVLAQQGVEVGFDAVVQGLNEGVLIGDAHELGDGCIKRLAAALDTAIAAETRQGVEQLPGVTFGVDALVEEHHYALVTRRAQQPSEALLE